MVVLLRTSLTGLAMPNLRSRSILDGTENDAAKLSSIVKTQYVNALLSSERQKPSDDGSDNKQIIKHQQQQQQPSRNSTFDQIKIDWSRRILFLSPNPSLTPTVKPTRPTPQPTGQPSRQPINRPTAQPSKQPINRPSTQPSRQPSNRPSHKPTRYDSLVDPYLTSHLSSF